MSELTVAEIRIAEIGIRLNSVESFQEDFKKRIEKSDHYTHVMYEDVIGRLSKMETTAARFETNLLHVNGNGDSMNGRLAGIEARLRSIERLAYIAIGGAATVTGLSTFFGFQVLKLLLKP